MENIKIKLKDVIQTVMIPESQEFIKELKEDFIKTLSNEFSHAYIIITPDKKGLIVDFSLDISVYDALTEKLKIKK